MLAPMPFAVVTLTRPLRVPDGTVVDKLVAVAVETGAPVMLSSRAFSLGTVEKFVPVTVSGVPAVASVGVKPVTVGAAVAPTVNDVLLVADPAVTSTAMGPVVAPAGTTATSCVDVAELTCAETPLNRTVFSDGTALNPVPEIVTLVATGPLAGVNAVMETAADPWRAIDVILPTAS